MIFFGNSDQPWVRNTAFRPCFQRFNRIIRAFLKMLHNRGIYRNIRTLPVINKALRFKPFKPLL